MDFRVEFLNYGRYGVVAVEPRTGLKADGTTEDEARDEMTRLLREHMESDFIPPDTGPRRSIEIISIEGESHVDLGPAQYVGGGGLPPLP